MAPRLCKGAAGCKGLQSHPAFFIALEMPWPLQTAIWHPVAGTKNLASQLCVLPGPVWTALESHAYQQHVPDK